MNKDKPIVDCVLIYPEEYLKAGHSAFVQPSNHPNHIEGHEISNNSPVHTSTVIEINLVDKMFETKNTIYRYTTTM